MTAEKYNRQELVEGRLTYAHVTELVRAYQRAHELTVDGMAGPVTRGMLERARPPMPVRVWPLPELHLHPAQEPRRPQVTSAGHWSNPSRPDHDGVDILYPWLVGDVPMRVGDGGSASRGPDGNPRWHIPLGTPAIASADGVVVIAGPTRTGYRVWLEHPERWHTGYFHLRSLAVAAGERVTLGQQLGTVGDNPAGPDAVHLHFETVRGDIREYPLGLADPMTWLAGATYHEL